MNKIHVLIIAFFSYMFWRLLHHFQGEIVCILKKKRTIVTVCNYIGLQTCIIHACNFICAFKKKCKDWKTSRTYILYICMCWIYSIILGTSRSASDFR